MRDVSMATLRGAINTPPPRFAQLGCPPAYWPRSRSSLVSRVSVWVRVKRSVTTGRTTRRDRGHKITTCTCISPYRNSTRHTIHRAKIGHTPCADGRGPSRWELGVHHGMGRLEHLLLPEGAPYERTRMMSEQWPWTTATLQRTSQQSGTNLRSAEPCRPTGSRGPGSRRSTAQPSAHG